MRELPLIKILNGSVDAIYYEMSYGGRHDIVPPIVANNPSTAAARQASARSDSKDLKHHRLTSAQVNMFFSRLNSLISCVLNSSDYLRSLSCKFTRSAARVSTNNSAG